MAWSGASRRAILSRILLSTRWPGAATRRDPHRSSRGRRSRQASPVSCRRELRVHRARPVFPRLYVWAAWSIPSRARSVRAAPAPESRPLTFPDDGYAPHEGVPPRVDSARHFLARVPSLWPPSFTVSWVRARGQASGQTAWCCVVRHVGLFRGTSKRDRIGPVFRLCGVRGIALVASECPAEDLFRDSKEKASQCRDPP